MNKNIDKKDIKRDKYLNSLIRKIANGSIKVITGIRRSGKSYLLNNIFYNYLLSMGINENQIIKFAFDSYRDLELINEDVIELSKNKRKVDAKKFVKYLENLTKTKEKYYLLLDEIQELEAFEYILNDLLKDDFEIYVSGSNSRLLSKDVITQFRGRAEEIHLLPLSFSEINEYKETSFEEYSLFGGLPAVILRDSKEDKISYLKSIVTETYLKDIIERNNIKNTESIAEILKILASNIGSFTNSTKLTNSIKSIKKLSISVNTIKSYIQYFEDSYLISTANRYDIKGKAYINALEKCYFEDIGIRNSILNFRQYESSHIMENIIYNELRYRGYSVDVGIINSREKTKDNKTINKNLEIDFVANLGSKRYYIQSALSMEDEDKLFQETRGFDKINDSFKKIIITAKEIHNYQMEKGYSIINVKEFLLNPLSLELC